MTRTPLNAFAGTQPTPDAWLLGSPDAPRLPGIDGSTNTTVRTFRSDAHTASTEPRALHRLVLTQLSNDLTLRELRRVFRAASRMLAPAGVLSIACADPDLAPSGTWPGAPQPLPEGRTTQHRPWRQLLELARILPFDSRTPRPVGGASSWLFRMEFVRQAATHEEDLAKTEDTDAAVADARYGSDSRYRNFDRLEEPEILDDLAYAAASMKPRDNERVLSIGVNDGRELEIFAEVHAWPELWGIDLAESAIERARIRFPDHADRMRVHDASRLEELELPQFDLVFVLNTFQCTALDRDACLRGLAKITHPGTRWLISIPNCHFGPTDILRRPLDRNDPRHDRGAALKDARYLTRHFHRAGYSKVTSFGTYDHFLLVRP
ncbi:MAG: class I SAM-dependent methyltransferase [Planctomycetota bacterium]